MKAHQKAVFALPAIIAFAGIPAFIVGLVKYPVLDNLRVAWISVLIMLPVDSIYVLFTAQWLRGLKDFKQLVILDALLTVLLFSWAAPGVVLLVNGMLDDSKPETYTVLALDKSYSNSTRGTGQTFYLEVADRARKGKTVSVEVSKPVYDGTKPGSTRVRLVTRKGFLGFERLLDHQIAE